MNYTIRPVVTAGVDAGQNLLSNGLDGIQNRNQQLEEFGITGTLDAGGIRENLIDFSTDYIPVAAQFIWIGRYKVDRKQFHDKTKKGILKKAGKNNFEKKVGDNPDIGVVNGEIILIGQGKFTGKTYHTGLKACDFFE